MPQQPSEQEVLLLSGESNLLFNKYGRAILAYVRLHAHSREESKDITLEVFQIALQYDDLAGIKESEQLKWLRRVASHKLVDRHRHARRHPITTLETVTDILFNDNTSDPEWLALQREASAHLRHIVQGLPRLDQHILRLRYGDQLSFAEIGQLLEKKETAVRKHHSRILARLRAMYERQKGE